MDRMGTDRGIEKLVLFREKDGSSTGRLLCPDDIGDNPSLPHPFYHFITIISVGVKLNVGVCIDEHIFGYSRIS